MTHLNLIKFYQLEAHIAHLSYVAARIMGFEKVAKYHQEDSAILYRMARNLMLGEEQ